MLEPCWFLVLADVERSLRALCRVLAGDVADPDEWEELIGLANRSLVTPALAERYRNDRVLPPALRPFFMTITTRSVHRNVVMRAQLVEAALALNKAGIVPLAFKGAALLAQHSEPAAKGPEGAGVEGLADGPLGGPMSGPVAGLENRIFADLDLFVPTHEMSSAILGLGTLEYTLDDEPGIHGATLSRDGDVGGIDLHTLLKVPHPKVDYAGIANECTLQALGEAQLLLPPPWLHAAMIIMHDQLQERDYWRGLMDLRHLIDLWRMTNELDDMGWDRLVAWFPSGYPRRAAQTQLMSLNWLFGPLPWRAATGGIRVKAQLLRRRVQLRYSWLGPVFTALTVIFDPPLRPGTFQRGNGSLLGRISSFAARLVRQPGTQKL